MHILKKKYKNKNYSSLNQHVFLLAHEVLYL